MSPTVEQAVAAFNPPLPLLVGFSAGADSTALLLACAKKWPGLVKAVHIHHGLQEAADDFVIQAQQFCEQQKIPLHIVYLNAKHGSGQSPEEVARRKRYAAIDQAVQELEVASVALAQHLDDQIETFVLALSRGAGLPGLSAMPMQWSRPGASLGQNPDSGSDPSLASATVFKANHGRAKSLPKHYSLEPIQVPFYRPLLKTSKQAILQYLKQQNTLFIEDPTNTDIQFTRNKIRHCVTPALEQAFPQYRDTFQRSIEHIVQAQRLIDELAQQDLFKVGLPPVIQELQQLSPDRLANVLRYWLKNQFRVSPSAVQLQELMRQIARCTTRGHQINIKIANGNLERQGQALHWYNREG